MNNTLPNDLIARYIYAVCRQLPAAMRADVQQELDSLISDMLQTRCGAVLPTDKDIRVVLTELGSPTEMAAKYLGSDNNSLISGNYYLIYRRVLRLVLPIAAAGIVLATLLANFLNWQPGSGPLANLVNFATMFGQVIGGAIGGAFYAFGVITLIFAIMERQKVNFHHQDDFLANLPQIPQSSQPLKPVGPIFGLMWLVVLAVFFLGFPQIAGVWVSDIGWIPLFQVNVLRSLWFFIALWLVFSATKEVFGLVEGQYSVRLAVATVILNSLSLVCAAIILLNNSLFNPDFYKYVGLDLIGAGGAVLRPLFTNINLLLLILVAFALLLDSVTVAFRSWQATRSAGL